MEGGGWAAPGAGRGDGGKNRMITVSDGGSMIVMGTPPPPRVLPLRARMG